VLGDPFVGIVHPCKIYNILALGSRVLYIGPSPSHITEMLTAAAGARSYINRHGDVKAVVASILAASDDRQVPAPRSHTARIYSQETLIPQLCQVIESGPLDRHR
jgi:hypothetical protein